MASDRVKPEFDEQYLKALRDRVFGPLEDLGLVRFHRIRSMQVCSCPPPWRRSFYLSELERDAMSDLQLAQRALISGVLLGLRPATEDFAVTVRCRLHTGECARCGTVVHRWSTLVRVQIDGAAISREYSSPREELRDDHGPGKQEQR